MEQGSGQAETGDVGVFEPERERDGRLLSMQTLTRVLRPHAGKLWGQKRGERQLVGEGGEPLVLRGWSVATLPHLEPEPSYIKV